MIMPTGDRPGAETVTLVTGGLRLILSARFGTVLALHYLGSGEAQPVLLPARKPVQSATDTAAFPLVPFGGRIAGNRFFHAGIDYPVAPATEDPLALHGDGWLGDWRIGDATQDKATLSFRHDAEHGAPWHYTARQIFSLSPAALDVTLSVTNTGHHAMPFGLGWHPYFPQSPETMLEAPATGFWREGPGHLPAERSGIPDGLNFSTPRPLPRHWINNGFEQWTGKARIIWPERMLSAEISASNGFDRYVLYQPAPAQHDAGSFFCFEPMTHTVNDLSPAGGMRVLHPGDTLSGTIRIDVVPL